MDNTKKSAVKLMSTSKPAPITLKRYLILLPKSGRSAKARW